MISKEPMKALSSKYTDTMDNILTMVRRNTTVEREGADPNKATMVTGMATVREETMLPME